MKKPKADLHVREQGIASVIEGLNSSRIESLAIDLSAQDSALQVAFREVSDARAFIAEPNHILGRMNTKHGEVAESIELAIRRADDALHQRDFSASFDGIGRLAPADYKIDGDEVQSKFINGSNNTIRKVIEHLDKYPFWGKDGEYYQIPKDQFEQVSRAYRGEPIEGFSTSSVEKIRSKVQEVVERTGKPFEEIIRPASIAYPESQLGVASKTLDGVEAKVSVQQESLKAEIRIEHEPSLKEAAQSAALAGALAAALNLAYGLYKKQKEGRSVFELTKADWKDLGLDSAKAGAGGAVTGLSIYGLTNYAGMSAPLAAAIASTARGVYTQIDLYKKGQLSQGELIDNSMALASEAGIVAICAVIGQTVIPIPVLGSILGSVVGKFISQILREKLGKASLKLIQRMEDDMTVYLAKLDAKYQQLVAKFMAEFDELGDLMALALDPAHNECVAKLSIELAEKLGVVTFRH